MPPSIHACHAAPTNAPLLDQAMTGMTSAHEATCRHGMQDPAEQQSAASPALLHSPPAPASLPLTSMPGGSPFPPPHPFTHLKPPSQVLPADQHDPLVALHGAAAAAAAAPAAAAGAAGHGQSHVSASASAGGTGFSALSLEELRHLQHAFATERDWDQFHTPRNLMLALVQALATRMCNSVHRRV